ncbi:MAG: hypothetical protein AAGF57_04705 [Pseudomonadota bacterium]
MGKDDDTLADHAKHLRAVHFAVVTLSLGLALASQLAVDTQLGLAMSQLNTIEKIRHRLSTDKEVGGVDEEWLISLALDRSASRFADQEVGNGPVVTINRSKDDDISYLLESKLYAPLFLSGPEHPHLRIMSGPYQESIESFEDFWNRINGAITVAVFKSFSESVYTAYSRGPGSPEMTEFHETVLGEYSTELISDDSFLPIDVHVRPIPDDSADDVAAIMNPLVMGMDATHYVWRAMKAQDFGTDSNGDGVLVIVAPSTYYELKINPQSYLRSRFSDLLYEAPLGSFAQSFPQLAAYASNLKALNVDDLRTVLQNEIERSGDKVEVLGISFPPEAIRTWGILVLLASQMYLLMHLSEFRKRAATAHLPQVAWIALYDGWGPKLSFILTAGILPVGAVMILALSLTTDGTYSTVSLTWDADKYIILFSCAAFLTSLTLGMSLLLVYRALFRKIVATPSTPKT